MTLRSFGLCRGFCVASGVDGEAGVQGVEGLPAAAFPQSPFSKEVKWLLCIVTLNPKP